MTNLVDKQYIDLIKYVLANGTKKDDRTGTGTIGIFDYTMRFNLAEGFPLLTTKKLHFKSIAYELLWFLTGNTNIKFLQDNGVKIWDQWAIKETKLHAVGDWGIYTPMAEFISKDIKTNDNIEEIENYIKNHTYQETKDYYGFYIPYDDNEDEDYIIQEIGELGPIYSKQWTAWGCNEINQIQNVIDQLNNNPDSRRIIVSAWNVDDLPDEKLSPEENIINGKMALAPCHAFFQFYTTELTLEERYQTYYHNQLTTKEERFKNIEENNNYSHEYLDNIGAPKRKLSCKLTQRSADAMLGIPFNIASYALLTHMIAQQCNLEVGELIWSGGDVHIYQNHLEQVNEQIKRDPYELPKLNIKRKPDSIFDYKFEDFEILNYKAHPSIKAKVAV